MCRPKHVERHINMKQNFDTLWHLVGFSIRIVQGFASALKADDSCSVMYYRDIIKFNVRVYVEMRHLNLRLLMSYIYIYIYGAHILDVSRSHTTTHHSL